MISASTVATSSGIMVAVFLEPLPPGTRPPWRCEGKLPDGRGCRAVLGRWVGREIVVDMGAINQGSGDPRDADNGMVLTDFELRVCCRVCKAVRVWSFGRRRR